jgi:hypothetical protein
MRIEEIIKLASMINQPAPAAMPNIVINISNGAGQEQPQVTVDQDPESDTAADGMMIPPLQQKIELMKKMAGEDSAYDPVCDTCGQSPCECDQEDDVAILKRNAGIPVIAQIADEDEPFEG